MLMADKENSHFDYLPIEILAKTDRFSSQSHVDYIYHFEKRLNQIDQKAGLPNPKVMRSLILPAL